MTSLGACCLGLVWGWLLHRVDVRGPVRSVLLAVAAVLPVGVGTAFGVTAALPVGAVVSGLVLHRLCRAGVERIGGRRGGVG